MIKTNLNNTNINDKNIEKFNKKIQKIVTNIKEKNIEDFKMMDWFNTDNFINENEINEIIKSVNYLKKELKVKKLLVIGIGGSFLGAKSGIDLLNEESWKDDVLFAGINISPNYIKQIEKKLGKSEWAICIISKSGTTLEPSLAFRYFRNQLISKKGSEKEASKYIISITDEKTGILKELSNKMKYKTFVVPNGVGGRFSAITPVGLYPLAFSGLDIKGIIEGYKQGIQDFTKFDNINDNQALRYAIARYILNKKENKKIEIFASYEDNFNMFNEWWKQLFGESEGKNGKGIFPTSALFTRDLHSLGQLIQEGEKIFFETIVLLKNKSFDITVSKSKTDLDDLNYLSGKTFNEINDIALHSVVDAHWKDGKVPNIILEFEEEFDEFLLGYTWYFFFIAVTFSGLLLEVNPFNQPGVEVYKRNLFKKLGK